MSLLCLRLINKTLGFVDPSSLGLSKFKKFSSFKSCGVSVEIILPFALFATGWLRLAAGVAFGQVLEGHAAVIRVHERGVSSGPLCLGQLALLLLVQAHVVEGA